MNERLCMKVLKNTGSDAGIVHAISTKRKLAQIPVLKRIACIV